MEVTLTHFPQLYILWALVPTTVFFLVFLACPLVAAAPERFKKAAFGVWAVLITASLVAIVLASFHVSGKATEFGQEEAGRIESALSEEIGSPVTVGEAVSKNVSRGTLLEEFSISWTDADGQLQEQIVRAEADKREERAKSGAVTYDLTFYSPSDVGNPEGNK